MAVPSHSLQVTSENKRKFHNPGDGGENRSTKQNSPKIQEVKSWHFGGRQRTQKGFSSFLLISVSFATTCREVEKSIRPFSECRRIFFCSTKSHLKEKVTSRRRDKATVCTLSMLKRLRSTVGTILVDGTGHSIPNSQWRDTSDVKHIRANKTG